MRRFFVAIVLTVASPMAQASSLDQITIHGHGVAGGQFELWGAKKPVQSSRYYSADMLGYTFLGAGSSTRTFEISSEYSHLVLGTRSEVAIDAIQLGDGVFLDDDRTQDLGNVHRPYIFDDQGVLVGSPLDYAHWESLNIYGPPDGLYDRLGHDNTYFLPLPETFNGTIAFKNTRAITSLFIGGNDHSPFAAGPLEGGKDAAKVRAQFEKLPNWEGSPEVIQFDYGHASPTLEADMFNIIKGAEEGGIEPGSTVVFYFAGHGSGSTIGGPSRVESLNLSADPSRTLMDYELAGWFNGTVAVTGQTLDPQFWNSVNKLFILDACHAGGFWDAGDDSPALASLPRTALIAATGETGLAHSDPRWLSGTRGEGLLSLALAEALAMVNGHCAADIDGYGLTFDDLTAYLASYSGYTNFDGQEVLVRDDGTAPFSWSVSGWASDDFRGNLVTVETPEPASLALLGLGTVLLLRRRRH